MTAHDESKTLLQRLSVLSFTTVTYVFFLGTFLAVVAFVEGIVLPKTIDTGLDSSLGPALLVNVSILGLFAIQHTIMARLSFKRWWTKFVSPAIERSIFVLATCSILVLLMLQWRAVPELVWSVETPWLATGLTVLSYVGWAIVLVATFLIDHFELFGLKQGIEYFRGKRRTNPEFQVRSLYRHTRHPLYLGFLIAFWATPAMTVGHLMFAGVVTAYLAIAIRIEEATLIAIHGDDYREYRRRVPMVFPVKIGSTRPTGVKAAGSTS